MQESYAGVILTGEKVAIRPMREDDSGTVVRWRNDPEIRRWLFKQKTLTLDAHLDWFRSPKPDRLDFIICLRETGQPIGTLSFSTIDLARGMAEAGNMIGERAFQGKGLMTEAFALWIAFGFERLGLTRIYLRTMESNQRAKRLNEKLGFIREKTIPGGHQVGGVSEGVVVMGLSRESAARHGIIREGGEAKREG
ncbi:MAG: GNAT family N-acetyltransferase [Candidatus Aureabacteria bacterium]|nr:GNAT family N-acetyltransferase [Candidatus Auribacterota bacterium]